MEEMKKFSLLFIGLFAVVSLWACSKEDSLPDVTGVEIPEDRKNEDIVSVIDYGVKNDGSLIGSKLNDLVSQSYGKTLFFPDGKYNMTEPIVLPLE